MRPTASLPFSASPLRLRHAQQPIGFAVGHCALGAILIAQSGRGLCAIALGDDPDALVEQLQARFMHAAPMQDDPVFAAMLDRAITFVEAPDQALQLPLDIQGTAFQQRVWQVLQGIAPGQTASYAQVAQRMGAPRAVRAVASACAANTLAVVIPCHRVVRQDGMLSGYRWGIERKRALLAWEAQQVLRASGAALPLRKGDLAL